MTPLIFILLTTLVLSILIRWVLATVSKQPLRQPRRGFEFESASELALQADGEYYLPQNSIKLQPIEDGWARVSWNLSRAKWEKACLEYHLKADLKYIVLRIQSDNGHFQELDLWVKSTAGQYKFQPQEHTSYCAILGTRQYNQFYPVLTSSTISSLAGS